MESITNKIPRRFNYGVEYLFFTPNQGREAQDILIKNNILTCRIGTDFVGVVDQFYMINALRNSSYKFFDSIVHNVDVDEEKEWGKYTVLRALDECELVEVSNAANNEKLLIETRDNSRTLPVKLVIKKAYDLLRENGITITSNGWYKVRLAC